MVRIKAKYAAAERFVGTWAKVSFKQTCGTINKKGQEVIPVIYNGITQSCRKAPEDPLIIKKHGKYALYTPKGKPITGFVYEWIGEDKSCKGLIPAKRGKQEFQLDRLGVATEIIPDPKLITCEIWKEPPPPRIAIHKKEKKFM